MNKRRIILTLSAVFALMASCGGDEPAKQETPAPAAPSNIVLHSSSETSLTFQWDLAANAAKYEWSLSEGGSVIQKGVANSRNVVINDLKPGTSYSFSVTSIGAETESGTKRSGTTTVTAATVTPEPEPEPEPDPEPTIAFDYDEFEMPDSQEDGITRAFPGAEGGGMLTTGGRGGAVYHVTNLNDSGEGSLRWAIGKKGARTIVFDVAGVIELQSRLNINNGDLTIAGQTAPGDGICLKNYTLRINASNVIIRYIRCRMGDEKATEDDAMNLYTESGIKNVIIDHCSISWSTDECGSFYGMSDFSLQWCILSESLRNSVHDKGKHGYGGLWGGENATYHHNLLAHHDSRNPRLDHDYLSPLKGPVTLANNVIYNWGDNSTYGGESANDDNQFRKYNIVNNYYKPGPATASSKIRFIDPWTKACDNCTKKTGSSTIVPGHYFLNGNIMDGNEEKTKDNWKGTTASESVIANIKSDTFFTNGKDDTFMLIQLTEDAYTRVLEYSGASLRRDAVDKRVTEETKTGKFTYSGSNGSGKGLIDSQKDVGGWPEYKATKEEIAAVKDSDGDGIPDSYEQMFGLDKSNASDGKAVTLDKNERYTNLEMYLHYLVKSITKGQK
ncbi:MAG: fibronectin type III domain-containing protein [Bacteroidales bacterium]|nr:fibronectin type III domain-containing protein [Bacteroidales bacterium]MBP3269366.1 fibronectin type III domain-containing protein [Bacteroidales bacterium]